MSADSEETRTISKHENKLYENDFTYDIELNRFFLRINGLWPTKTKSSKILAEISIILSIFLLIFFFVPQGCFVFLVEEDSAAQLRMFGPWSFTAMAIVKYFIVLFRYKDLGSCIETIDNDWRRADDVYCRPIMLRYGKTSRLITKLYVSFTFGGVGFYTAVLPFLHKRDEGNSTGRPFAYPGEYYVLDPQKSPNYEIIFLGQAMSMLGVVCTLTCGICTITVKFVMHACGLYEIVVAFVRSVNDHHRTDNDRDQDDNFADTRAREIFVKRRLGEIIQRHLYAAAFVAKIEDAFNETCLVDLVGSTVNICVLGYDLIMGWADTDVVGLITYLMLMSAFVTNVFLFCWIGECLTEQCRQVGEASYMTNWWGLPEAQARALILLIAISDTPVKFTAGKMMNLSLQTFASVMKASVAYLNALRAMM